jgi:iron(III) transport system substrate-binding protein
MDRRLFLRTLAAGAATALVAACQSAAPAAPTSAPAKPTAAAKTEAPVAGAKPDAKAPAAAAKPAWEQQWNDLLEAAKKEGSITISGPPTQEVRTELTAKFKDRFGIEMEYLGGRSGDLMTRVESERQAGQYTLDAMIGGAQTLYTRVYGKISDPLPPVLIHPEATDPTKWKTGKLWFMDPENAHILRITNQASHFLGVNEQYQNPAEIKAWKDLIDPKYKGKIAAFDPTVSGPGWPPAGYMLKTLGEDYVRALYQGQEVAITRDERQMSDWLARGTYPIAVSPGSNEVESLKKDGFKIAILRDLPDAPGSVSAGFGLIALVNKAPHPNAAKLFVNWMATQEGGEVYNRAQLTISNRTDVKSEWAPDYMVPTPGVEYFDTYDWDFTINGFNPESTEMMKRFIAR